jgi:hypothetical protein
MFTLSRYDKGPMDRLELKRIMRSWPQLMSQTTDPWSKRFSTNIWEKSANPFWLPTLKQAHFMRILYQEISMEREDIHLLD